MFDFDLMTLILLGSGFVSFVCILTITIVCVKKRRTKRRHNNKNASNVSKTNSKPIPNRIPSDTYNLSNPNIIIPVNGPEIELQIIQEKKEENNFIISRKVSKSNTNSNSSDLFGENGLVTRNETQQTNVKLENIQTEKNELRNGEDSYSRDPSATNTYVMQGP